MSEQAERFYSEMYSVQDSRISWGEYVARLYDTDEIELQMEQEIVRCCDCKKRNIGWCLHFNNIVKPDGFCAWGERREGDAE